MSDFETVPRGTMAAQKELSEKWIFKIARLEDERDALAVHLEKIMPIAQYGLRAARCRNDPASLEWTNTLADTPATSLTRQKLLWQMDLLQKIKPKDPYTNNGDIREDAERRIGWNDCLGALRRQAEGGE